MLPHPHRYCRPDPKKGTVPGSSDVCATALPRAYISTFSTVTELKVRRYKGRAKDYPAAYSTEYLLLS